MKIYNIELSKTFIFVVAVILTWYTVMFIIPHWQYKNAENPHVKERYINKAIKAVQNLHFSDDALQECFIEGLTKRANASFNSSEPIKPSEVINYLDVLECQVPIVNFDGINQLPNLSHLTIKVNKQTSFLGLSNNATITKIVVYPHMSSDTLTSVHGLSKVANLKTLFFTMNDITANVPCQEFLAIEEVNRGHLSYYLSDLSCLNDQGRATTYRYYEPGV